MLKFGGGAPAVGVGTEREVEEGVAVVVTVVVVVFVAVVVAVVVVVFAVVDVVFAVVDVVLVVANKAGDAEHAVMRAKTSVAENFIVKGEWSRIGCYSSEIYANAGL